MKAYAVTYSIDGKTYEAYVDASSATYVRRKLARKHKVDERKVKLQRTTVIGYY